MPAPQLIGPGLRMDDAGSSGHHPPAQPTPSVSTALPPDLQVQVRDRVRLLALLLLVAFAFDPLAYVGRWVAITLAGNALPAEFFSGVGFQLVSLAAVAASGGLWWVASRDRFSTSNLHTLGLAYEVVICLVISLNATWEYFLDAGVIPNMNWVPAVVILFPLVLPGPPRRMLAAAVASAAMTPVAILVLDLTNRVTTSTDSYIRPIIQGAFAVGFAYMGARVVYGLGREVAKAREMGSYQLGKLLGKGGMGEVYTATHRMLARPAAIKLIRPEVIGPGHGGEAQLAIRRFWREAEVAASLRSPHTVELYDFGVTSDRTFYFVMELLDGMDLESLVRQKGPVPAKRVIHILRQVCESLEEAHARGLVHRDIKPANIHIGRLGLRHDFVKVLDFGLVKSVSGENTAQSLATAAGQVAGTPAYMAPEMAMGEGFDGRADIYALGCVAYYLLTGQLVFEATSSLGMIARHMRDQPVPPSQRTELAIPPEVERLVLSCLAKSPEERPPSAEALSTSLSAIEGEPWGEAQAMQWWKVNWPA